MRQRRPNDSTLDKCSIHQSVFEECVKALIAERLFNKERIVAKLGLQGVSSAIHWDYIRRRIETGIKAGGIETKLLPVAAAIFKKHRAPGVNINTLIAGPGGKSAGYALATIDGGKIALAVVQLRMNQTSGARAATRTRAEILAKSVESESQQIAGQIRQAGGVPPTLSNGNGQKP